MLGRNELLGLVREAQRPAVTMTLPTHRAYPETQQDPIRFRNLLVAARKQLVDYGISNREAGYLLEPAEALLTDSHFWLHQDNGLAVFVDTSGVRTERIPIELRESVQVGGNFSVRPFLPLLDGATSYLVLAAAYDDVRLYEGDEKELRPIETDEIPRNMAELTGMTEIEPAVHFHPSGPSSTTTGAPTPKFHSLGTSPRDEHEKLRQHFAGDLARALDDYVSGDEHRPVVLIADERLAGAVAAHAETELISTRETQASPAELDTGELHALAWSAFGATLGSATEKALSRFHAHYNDRDSKLASIDLGEIGLAALMGRIETLLMDAGADLRGRLDPDTGVIETGERGEDVADALARHTLLTGGDVRLVAPGALPDDAALGAIFRYEL